MALNANAPNRARSRTAVHVQPPLAEVITTVHEPSRPRVGDRSRAWWQCPFHDDRNPSLCIEPGGAHFHCFGCGARGDAIDFVRRLNPGMSFREAVAAIGGDLLPAPAPRPPGTAASRKPASRPEGWQDFARGIVEEAEAALRSDGGIPGRTYLDDRGLSDETVRAARLGYRPADERRAGPFADKPAWIPQGIVIPWFDGERIEAVNLRRPTGATGPKYVMLRGSRRGLYPGRGAIPRGRPLLLVEGEFEALLLNQELVGLAVAVTLGSAGARPDPRVLDAMAAAAPWIVAGDADDAGRKSAEAWLARSGRCRRVGPPGAFKDWTEAYQGGVNLRRWWCDVLAGVERPPLYTYEELKSWRWGPAVGDPTPGIDAGPRVGARGGAHTR
jgi:hypothetical protein